MKIGDKYITIYTVGPHLSGLQLSGSSDYSDTKFSRATHLHVLSEQKMATPIVKCKRVVLFLLSLLYICSQNVA